MTNKRRMTALVVIAAAAIIVAGGLMASNMGFKLNYPLQAQQSGVSASGFQSIGLPYNRQVGIDTASQLKADVEAGGVGVGSIQKYDILTGQNVPYPLTDFPLAEGEGYLIGVLNSGSYIIVGSHDPGFNVNFKAQAVGVSASGFQRYAPPYHGVASTASELKLELAPEVVSVQKYDILTGQNIPYPLTDFPIVPGESYLVGVTADKTFVPAHY
jgi:hypothetical protein